MSESLDIKRLGLWLERCADRLEQMQDQPVDTVLGEVKDAYEALEFIVKVVEGRAYLRGGR